MTDQMSREASQTFPLDGPINLLVRIGHGSVRVQTRDGLTEARVRIAHRGDGPGGITLPSVVAVVQGTTLHVAAPLEGGLLDLFGRGPRAAVDVEVVVPTRTAVRIRTIDAPIAIIGRVSGADVAFARGSAELGEVDGDLRLRFGQGTVRAARVGGGVQVRSGGGDVTLGEVGGSLHCGCGTGNLDVAIVRGAVHVRAGSGGTRLGEVHGDVDIASASGAMQIGLPSDVMAQVDARTGSGRVLSDLPVEDEPSDRPDGVRASITLRARTGRGDVRLVRSA